jgi:hypothetical protein
VPPGRSDISSKRLPNSGGQYTNTDSAAQEKRLEIRGRMGGKMGRGLAARAALDELVEEEPGEPGLVVADHAGLMQHIARDVA